MQTCWECGSNLQIIRGEPYHYVECGLDNVYLHGINQYRCPRCGEDGPEIPKVEELHLFIGKNIVCQEAQLTGPEIRFLRKELGLKSKEMANILSVAPETYSKWENSRGDISEVYDMQLRLLYVLNAEDRVGKVLHKGIRFARNLSLVRKKPKDKGKIEISANEWLMPFKEPLFSETCI